MNSAAPRYLGTRIESKERLVEYASEKGVCVTECPYNAGVKVGSCRCNDCASFVRKNMTRKYVICKIILDNE